MIYRHYGWVPMGQCVVINVQCIHGEQFSILSTMTIEGYVATCIVSGSVEGEEFFNFIVEDVVCHDALSSLAQLFMAP